MIKKEKVNGTKLRNKIDPIAGMYAVNSEAVQGLLYFLRNKGISILRGNDFITADWEDIDELLELCMDADVKEELRALYEDCKELHNKDIDIEHFEKVR